MPDTLPVHLNRESLHSLDVPDGIETDGSFDVVLVNHGEAVHVHLHLDDALSRLASLDANNHYVRAESKRPIRVTVNREGEVRGKLKVVTAYGAETRYVDVDLSESDGADGNVQVDESLAKPMPKESEGRFTDGLLENVESPVYLLAGFALIIAGLVAMLVPVTTVRVGSFVVFLAVVAGLALLRIE